ncbi:sigma-70 family RNA polymerase sigma factor [Microbacterium sp. SORGH_AS_0888]|uniref:sigma-70 family RNA polymerase sigma factor n=1 Tax=Microbacterium sp. SORGH_AS_0888 TaxID=3041791 RepID=UPI0027872790|nr:sigma-70 family RNA polymerase sigma factor [Microbacterium sp. SORGH_AS_0888]MDQ1129991.1 RNA polymerase sigma factor (sigma-70 family) [Microbacterium sp. SORGH_AS_0888]
MAEEPHELVRRVAELYPRVAPELARYARRLGVAPSDVDDLVADAFHRVLSMPPERAADVVDLRPYLFAVTRNLAMRVLRSRQQETVAPNEHLDLPVAISDAVSAEETVALARRAFDALTELDRRVIWLMTVEDRSASEVGALLGMSPTNVTTRAQRARERLRTNYLTAFLAQSSVSCGIPVELIAKHVTGTIGRREEKRFRLHALECRDCVVLVGRAREEMRSGSLLGILVIGGIALGYPVWSPPHPAAAAEERTAKTSAARRTLVSASGVLALTALLSSALIDTAPPGDSGTVLDAIEPDAPRDDAHMIEAEPARVHLQMPAPGERAGWSSRVRNTSGATVGIALVLGDVSADPALAHDLAASIRVDGVPTVPTTTLGAITGHVIYLGTVPKGAAVDVEGVLDRARSSTARDGGMALTARFIASASPEMLTADGDGAAGPLIDIRTWNLAETGSPPTWPLLLGGTTVALVGAVLTIRARAGSRRERRRV